MSPSTQRAGRLCTRSSSSIKTGRTIPWAIRATRRLLRTRGLIESHRLDSNTFALSALFTNTRCRCQTCLSRPLSKRLAPRRSYSLQPFSHRSLRLHKLRAFASRVNTIALCHRATRADWSGWFSKCDMAEAR